MIALAVLIALGAAMFVVGMCIGSAIRSYCMRSRDELFLSVRRLQLRQGDRIVLATDKELTGEQVAHIQRWWREFAGDECQCAVLSGGLKLHVISAAS